MRYNLGVLLNRSALWGDVKENVDLFLLLTGVHSSFVDLLFFMTVLVLSSLAGSSISFFFSSLFSVQAVASVCLALTLAVMVVIVGLL